MSAKEKAPPPPPPSLEEASSKMGGRSDAIKGKLDQIDKDLMKYKAEWKRNPRNTMAKTRCMNLLKQKKMYEQQVNTIDNQMFNMDQASFAHQSMEGTIAMVQAMKETSRVMKEQFKAPEMDLDMIMEMQDDIAELMEESQEINEVLGQDYGLGDEIDEDDLMNELDMLEGEMADESMLHEQVGGVPSYMQSMDPGPPMDAQPAGLDAYGLPTAPTGPVPAHQQGIMQ